MVTETNGRTLVSDGNYLFSNESGSLVAWKILEDNTLKKKSELKNICANIWKLEIDINHQLLVAACRSDGVYIVDYSDIDNMTVVSHYDTNEFATDVSIDNDYLAIASRYFGVEIVDISDVANPTYVSDAWMPNEEFESCIMNGRYCVKDEYMYFSQPTKIVRLCLNGQEEKKEYPAISNKYSLYGKLQILDKYLICIEEIRKDLTIYEIEEGTGDLLYRMTVRFTDGFPDLGCLDDEGNILIPLKHIGLIKIIMD